MIFSHWIIYGSSKGVLHAYICLLLTSRYYSNHNEIVDIGEVDRLLAVRQDDGLVERDGDILLRHSSVVDGDAGVVGRVLLLDVEQGQVEPALYPAWNFKNCLNLMFSGPGILCQVRNGKTNKQKC